MATGSETTLDLRLPSALKEAVAVAAAHLGQTVDEFAVGVLAQTAREVIEHSGETPLTERDWERFLALVADLESEPKPALRAAAARIESIQTGDQVLTQDPVTAELSYQPVLAAVKNKPDRLVEINLGTEVIRATEIHRFWKAGQGWVAARDLEPGDSLRALGGVAVVKSIKRGQTQPVFNLKVLRAQSFFVGHRGTLVHDNSPVEAVAQPFDVVAELNPGQSESRVDRPALDAGVSLRR